MTFLRHSYKISLMCFSPRTLPCVLKWSTIIITCSLASLILIEKSLFLSKYTLGNSFWLSSTFALSCWVLHGERGLFLIVCTSTGAAWCFLHKDATHLTSHMVTFWHSSIMKCEIWLLDWWQKCVTMSRWSLTTYLVWWIKLCVSCTGWQCRSKHHSI